MCRFLLLIPFVFCVVSKIPAQDTMLLKVIEVEDTYTPPKSHTVEVLVPDDVVHEGAQLSELLQRKSLVNVKNYGPSQVSSASFRGSDPNHTQLYWNGININAPTLGQADMNLLTTSGIDKVEVAYGTAGNTMGNGAIGGSVNLFSEAEYGTKGIEIGTYADGLNSGRLRLEANAGNDRFAFSASTAHFRSTNSFTYPDVSKQPFETALMQHAHLVSTNMVIGASHKIGAKGEITVSGLLIENERQVPRPINASTTGSESLADSNMIWAVGYSRNTENWKTQFISGLNLASNVYSDTLYKVYGRNTYASYQTRWINEWKLSEILALSAISAYHLDKAQSLNFPNNVMLHSLFMFVEAKWEISRSLFLNLGNKVQITDNQLPGLVLPTAGLVYRIGQFVGIYTNGARTIRNPTLNELHWEPGGNVGLKPEKALTSEAGFFGNNGAFLWRINGYYNEVENWVRWLPASGAVFSPRNLDHVIAKGLEGRFNYLFGLGKLSYNLFLNGTYTTSQRIPKLSSEEKRQLIYIPKYQANGGITFRHANWALTYHQHWVGQRFVSFDNSVFMPAFSVGALSVGHTRKFSSHSLYLGMEVNNVWGTQYQNVAWRPMPGRYVGFQIDYTYNK